MAAAIESYVFIRGAISSMIFKALLGGFLCALAVCVAWANPPEPLDAPARALDASQAANLPAPVLLWENGAPGAKGDSDEDKPAIYPFLPTNESTTGCGVIVAPGGAFTHRAMDQEGVTFGKWFAERGIAAFVLRYRIQPLYGRSDYLLDGQRSVQFVKAHAAEYGISPERVGMIGFSAGSDLTTMVAYQALSPQVDSSDVVERQSSKIAFMMLAYGGSQPRAGVNLSDVPPTFMFCTEEDRSHAGGMISLYRAYFDAKVPAEIHIFPNGEHGTGLADGDRQIGEWPKLMFRWLQAGNFLSAQPGASVSGHVLLDGKPLAHGSITFVPIDDIAAGLTRPAHRIHHEYRYGHRRFQARRKRRPGSWQVQNRNPPGRGCLGEQQSRSNPRHGSYRQSRVSSHTRLGSAHD